MFAEDINFPALPGKALSDQPVIAKGEAAHTSLNTPSTELKAITQ
jgi:hypothetical protein